MSSGTVVKDANSAIEIATKTLQNAGHSYITIGDVYKEDDNWIVVTSTVMTRLRLVISNTGEVLSMRSERESLRPEPKK